MWKASDGIPEDVETASIKHELLPDITETNVSRFFEHKIKPQDM